jgi:hypothetical protein
MSVLRVLDSLLTQFVAGKMIFFVVCCGRGCMGVGCQVV